ncbi:CDP-alcohol phosphatidyltransferase [Achromatium sp. WMS3]|nr:CDP-alcohol phosphatidyltransferase [Achromatium sp. WMS3]
MQVLAFQYIPNCLSIMRILLAFPVGFLLLKQEYGWTLAIFILAGISDGLDGFLAKRFGWQSRLGGILDPLADKVLFIVAFLILGILGLIHTWLVIAAIIRDLIIMSGAIFYQLIIEEIQPAPSRLSKLNTILQTLLVILVIIDAGIYTLPRIFLDSLQWILLVTLILSGSHYVFLWGHRALYKTLQK